MARRMRGALGVAWLVACAPAVETDDLEDVQPDGGVEHGGFDSDTAPMFHAVVGVATDTWVGTGVVISDRVVLTAAHLVPSYINGCSSYDGQAPSSAIRVFVGHPGPPFHPGDVFASAPEDIYAVDAVTGLPTRTMPANVYTCCGGSPFGCLACVDTALDNYNLAFDFALLHVDRPLQDIQPMRLITRTSADDPQEGSVAIDPTSLTGKTLVIAGVGVDPPSGTQGRRKWGTVQVTELGWAQQMLAGDPCAGLDESPPATAPFACDSCMIRSVPTSPVQGHGGDSGGPLIINHPLVPESTHPDLPAGVPFMVGLNAGEADGVDFHPALWNAPLAYGDSSGVGTFLETHIRDWDQDGLPDPDDDCPIIAHLDQRDCVLKRH